MSPKEEKLPWWCLVIHFSSFLAIHELSITKRPLDKTLSTQAHYLWNRKCMLSEDPHLSLSKRPLNSQSLFYLVFILQNVSLCFDPLPPCDKNGLASGCAFQRAATMLAELSWCLGQPQPSQGNKLTFEPTNTTKPTNPKQIEKPPESHLSSSFFLKKPRSQAAGSWGSLCPRMENPPAKLSYAAIPHF